MSASNVTEEDSEEEEFLVYVDFDNHLLSSELSDENFDLKMIGIESEHPIFDVNGKIFKGTYDFSIGTHVFFEKDTNTEPSDPLYDHTPEETYKLQAKTNKVLHLKRIFLTASHSNPNNLCTEQEESMEELRSKYGVKTTYLEALNTLLPPGQQQPPIQKKESIPETQTSTESSAVEQEHEEEEEDEQEDDDESMTGETTDENWMKSLTSNDDNDDPDDTNSL